MKRGTAIILAGGKSRRMRRDKALVTILGEPLILRIVRIVAPLFESLIVVTNDDLGVDLAGAIFVHDSVPDQGPLGGIHAGLTASRSEDNFVVACDMPFINAEVVERIRSLRGKAAVALPETADGLEPLCAAYSRSCLPAVEEAMAAGKRRIIAFFDRVEVREISRAELADIPGVEYAFLNVNTESDLEAAIMIAGG
ncbi:MAG: molybdenum cofactor guanylyltransferase [Actinobacteria bacterium]|nr:molybdenum cofactor guanylyltransferase [Actinomycetota bacterium]